MFTNFIVLPFKISVYVVAPWYPFYRATKYFNKGWIKTNTGFFSESSLSWPAGTYGIPKPQSGCPKTDHFHWLEGWRSQGSNSRNLNNSCSVEFHLDGKVDNTMVNRSFCIKHDILYDSARPAWPKGLFWYFFRTWASCPGGGGGSARPIFGSCGVAEGFKPWPCLGQYRQSCYRDLEPRLKLLLV